MGYSLAADAIVGIHVAYVGFILLGQALILAGLGLKWDWTRNPWFRISHLAAIAIVALEAVAGIVCPLTHWEYRLRVAAGEDASGRSFIGRMLHGVLFYDVEPRILNACYIGFAALVLITFAAAPPRFRRRPAPSNRLPGPAA